MTSWSEFAAQSPDLADAVRRTFATHKHGTMATIRADGGPRISGTEIEFDTDGNVYLAMMPGTRRAADLRRDPRVAVHCPTVTPPPDDTDSWLGDGKILATAHEVTAPDGGAAPDRFRLDLQQVVWTRVRGSNLDITSWQPGTAGVRDFRRD